MNTFTHLSNHASISILAAKSIVRQSIASLEVFQIASPESRSLMNKPLTKGSKVYKNAITNIIPCARPGNNCPSSLLIFSNNEPRNINAGAIIVIARKSGRRISNQTLSHYPLEEQQATKIQHILLEFRRPSLLLCESF